jgi:hypothetical protein
VNFENKTTTKALLESDLPARAISLVQMNDLLKNLAIDPATAKKSQQPAGADSAAPAASVVPNDVGVVIGAAAERKKYDVSDPNLNVVDVESVIKKLEGNDPSVDSVNLNR